MRYYSYVALALSAKAEKALQEMISALPGEDRAMIGGSRSKLGSDRFRKDGGGNTLRLWESVKWYADFPDTKVVMNFIAGLDWEDFKFLRVGAEACDIDRKGLFTDSFNLRYITRILYDAPE